MAQERLVYEADEFSGTDPIAKAFPYTDPAPILVRAINELDVQANAEIELTDGMDGDFDYPRRAAELTMLGGTGNPDDHEGGYASDLLSEPWERIRVTVVPAAPPTAGRLILRTATHTG